MGVFPSDSELFPADLRVRTPDELVLALLCIEGAVLQVPTLQREARAYLLQLALRTVFLEVIPVVPEKDKVALVVKGHRPSADEVWILREKGGQLPAQSTAQPRDEVVKNELR